jgi:hypothetical protein
LAFRVDALFTVHRRDRTLMGFIVAPKRGDVEAFDHAGRSFGRFPNKDAPTKVVYEQAAEAR